MIPGIFVPLRELPRTITGKLDRKALPPPDRVLRDDQASHVAPRSQVEQILAGLWSQVLGIDKVGATDRFFELGGHSILAMQVLARMKDAFGVEIPLAAMLDDGSLAGVAARIETALRRGVALPSDPLTPVDRNTALPLSFTQQRLWFLEQLSPGTSAYLIPAAVAIAGPLDADRLEESLNALVARHEGLRTGFVADRGTGVQVIAPDARLPLRRFDLSDLTPAPPRRSCGGSSPPNPPSRSISPVRR
jgi:acyl carrier protein